MICVYDSRVIELPHRDGVSDFVIITESVLDTYIRHIEHKNISIPLTIKVNNKVISQKMDISHDSTVDIQKS